VASAIVKAIYAGVMGK